MVEASSEPGEWRRLRGDAGQALLVSTVPALAGKTVSRGVALPVSAGLGQLAALRLSLVLQRQPTVADVLLEPLLLQGSLTLPLSLALPTNAANGRTAAFLSAVEALLIWDGEVLGVARAAGTDARITLVVQLRPAAAWAVLAAFTGVESGVEVRLRALTAAPPPFEPITLDRLLGSIDAAAHVETTVADGVDSRPRRLVRDVPVGTGAAQRGFDPPTMVRHGSGAVDRTVQLSPSPSRRPAADVLIRSDLASEKLQLGADHLAIAINDLIVLPTEPPGLPLVDDPAAAIWRAADGGCWYAPAITLVAPQPSDPPDTAAFAFMLSRKGLTAAGGAGGLQQGLAADVRFTLELARSAATEAAWAALGQPQPIRPVPLEGLSATLEIDYRVSGETGLRTQRMAALVDQSETALVCTLTLLNDWARLAYAGLAGLQQDSLPAVRLVVAYGFQARVPLAPQWPKIIAGGKIVGLPVVYHRSGLAALDGGPALVASERAVVADSAVLAFPVERAGAAMRGSPMMNAAFVRPAFAVNAVANHDATILSPSRPRTGVRTMARQQAIGVTIPCGDFGGLYCQVEADGGRTAIGCQDALKLGATNAHAFEEIPQLRQPDYRVWRSLQQPGRFLVQPTTYRVGRYAADHPTLAFRPVMMLYGVLTDDRAKDRYTVSATMIPDVTPARLALLTAALVALSPADIAPAVFWPTDPSTGAATTVSWSAPPSLMPQVQMVADGMGVTVTTNPDDALLFSAMTAHGGLQGQISFTLPDGLRLDCALSLDGLTAGPSDAGPVTVAVDGETATLTNRTAQAMNVFALACRDTEGRVTTAPAGVTLAPGESADAAVAPGTVLALADAKPAAAATLEELDLFVEDVTQTVQFINQIAFGNHGLVALEVAARIAGSPHEERAALAEGAVANLAFTLPITAYLRPVTLEYAFTRTDADGAHTTPWRSRDLTTGSVIGVTFDQI